MTAPTDALPAPIRAVAGDLPASVRAALAAPTPGEDGTVEAGGRRWATLGWGDPAAPPVLLIHGVTASAAIWWRLGPALAVGLGRRVVAVDQAGHGRTGHWTGHDRFADNAADVAGFAAAAGLDRPDLAVVGHSWGGMTAAALPGAGLVPGCLVLLDPPAIPLAAIASRMDDPVEHPYADLDAAIHAVGAAYPTWPWGDVVGKAEALHRFDVEAVRAVLTRNGDWDGGLAALADPAAARVPTWLIRGVPAAGGLIPDAAAARIGERIGHEHVITIADGGHSPMRLHPEATTLALLRAIGTP